MVIGRYIDSTGRFDSTWRIGSIFFMAISMIFFYFWFIPNYGITIAFVVGIIGFFQFGLGALMINYSIAVGKKYGVSTATGYVVLVQQLFIIMILAFVTQTSDPVDETGFDLEPCRESSHDGRKTEVLDLSGSFKLIYYGLVVPLWLITLLFFKYPVEQKVDTLI